LLTDREQVLDVDLILELRRREPLPEIGFPAFFNVGQFGIAPGEPPEGPAGGHVHGFDQIVPAVESIISA
jgi:hypothetical protein